MVGFDDETAFGIRDSGVMEARQGYVNRFQGTAGLRIHDIPGYGITQPEGVPLSIKTDGAKNERYQYQALSHITSFYAKIIIPEE